MNRPEPPRFSRNRPESVPVRIDCDADSALEPVTAVPAPPQRPATPPPAPHDDVLSVVSFCLGVVGLPLVWVWFAFFVGPAFVAIYTGVLGSAKSGPVGRVMAIVGVVLGAIAVDSAVVQLSWELVANLHAEFAAPAR